jgi:hypothetical protein
MLKFPKKIVLYLILCLISFYSVTIVVGAFPYVLSSEDLPEGYELVQTTVNTDLQIAQVWKTPTDTTGMTSLTVDDSGTVSNASTVMGALALFGPTSVSVSGADEAKKVELLMISTIYAREGKYIIISAAFAATEAEVITIIEAQITKISGNGGGDGGVPGFILFSSIAAIAVMTKKQRK